MEGKMEALIANVCWKMLDGNFDWLMFVE